MAGFSNISGDESIMFANNASFDGTERGGKMTTDGQLWIGSTASPRVKLGNIVAADSSVTIGYASPNITVKVNTGALTDLHTAKWIVNSTPNAGGNCASITAALLNASSGDTIFVMPGSTGIYTENLTLKAGVNIVAFTGDGAEPNVTIIGKLTMTSAGTASIGNIRLQTNSDFFLAVTGSAASIVNLNNCYLNCSNNTGISFTTSNGSGAINLIGCIGNLGTTGIALFASSSAGAIGFTNCSFTNTGGSSTASTISAGHLNMGGSQFLFPITSSSTGITSSRSCNFDTSAQNVIALTIGGGSGTTQIFDNNFINSGSASAISIGANIVNFTNTSIYSTHATTVITGAGRLFYGNLTFLYNSWVDVANFDPLIKSNDGMNVTTPSAYPYTVRMWDGLVAVDTASARTINLPAPSPAGATQPGVQIIIKDAIGTSDSNNVTITPQSCQIDGSSSSKTINIPFGSYTFVWGGTFWFTV